MFRVELGGGEFVFGINFFFWICFDEGVLCVVFWLVLTFLFFREFWVCVFFSMVFVMILLVGWINRLGGIVVRKVSCVWDSS